MIELTQDRRKNLIAEASHVYQHGFRNLMGVAQDCGYLDTEADMKDTVYILPERLFMFAAFILLAEGEEL